MVYQCILIKLQLLKWGKQHGGLILWYHLPRIDQLVRRSEATFQTKIQRCVALWSIFSYKCLRKVQKQQWDQTPGGSKANPSKRWSTNQLTAAQGYATQPISGLHPLSLTTSIRQDLLSLQYSLYTRPCSCTSFCSYFRIYLFPWQSLSRDDEGIASPSGVWKKVRKESDRKTGKKRSIFCGKNMCLHREKTMAKASVKQQWYPQINIVAVSSFSWACWLPRYCSNFDLQQRQAMLN